MYVRAKQLGFGALGGFRGFGALIEHEGVRALQRYLNTFAAEAGFSPLSLDGRYGAQTHATLRKFVKYYSALPRSTLLYVGDLMFDNMGPLSVIQFLSPGLPPRTGLTVAQVADASKGFTEWVAAGRPSGSTATPGEELPGEETLVPGDEGDGITGEDITPPQAKKAGLGTLGWVLIGIGVVAAGGTVYYFATRKSPETAPAGLFGW